MHDKYEGIWEGAFLAHFSVLSWNLLRETGKLQRTTARIVSLWTMICTNYKGGVLTGMLQYLIVLVACDSFDLHYIYGETTLEVSLGSS